MMNDVCAVSPEVRESVRCVLPEFTSPDGVGEFKFSSFGRAFATFEAAELSQSTTERRGSRIEARNALE